MRKIKVKHKNEFSKAIAIPLLLLMVLVVIGCDIVKPEEVIHPGKLNIKLVYSYGNNYGGWEYDALYVQARDFKIFNEDNFADVFQDPDQFLEIPDSIVLFNMLETAGTGNVIEVANGSLPPLEYDSLYFQITPVMDFVLLDRRFYPITTNYNSLSIENNYSKVVKIRDKIKIEENKTTTLVLEFKVEENLFRILDDFVFSATVDTFYISNE